jgi:hypothetical protein
MSRLSFLFLLWWLLPTIVYAQAEKTAYELGVEGVLKVDAGDYDEGIKLLKQARNKEPQEYDYTFEIGKAYFKSGNPKKAEKHLFPLQYHANVQADLYILLADCYKELEELKKTPDEERKREFDALRYGIQKLPKEGVLYRVLGKRNIELEKPVEALAVFETGIQTAPNYPENYFWAAKLLKGSGNLLWAWLYSELFFNMSDDEDLKRSAAILISSTAPIVLSNKWKGEPDKLDQDLRYINAEKCGQSEYGSIGNRTKKIACLLESWDYKKYQIEPLFSRLKLLQDKDWSEAYIASMVQVTDKEHFLAWVSQNAPEFEAYRSWRFWNPIHLSEPINRLAE